MLEVELVGPDGSVLVANAEGTLMTSPYGQKLSTANNDLFWALRGGGGSTW
jgi:hypothetical protein